MKTLKLLAPLFLLILTSCSSVKVIADYDVETDFNQYKTFAFYKSGIDKAAISDLDKKRILRAIESEMLLKGYTKSSNPAILISIFTKSREKVNINQNNNLGWGYGYGPWFYRNNFNQVQVSQKTEGTLFIDIIDKEKKELIWQGIGSGALRMENVEKKEIRIKEFVQKIMSQYPPKPKK